MAFVNTKKALNTFVDTIVRRAKLELGTTRPRERRVTKWRNAGTKKKPVWKVKSSIVKMKRGRYVATGNLQKSIKGEVLGDSRFTIRVFQADYGANVEAGRLPKSKMPPMSAIAGWTKTKRLQPRGKDNKFIANSKTNRKGMNYVISRSIAEFGIKPFPYMDMALDYAVEKHIGDIRAAIQKDIQDGIND
jgi:hypothetical protein